jgi:F-type H+-transporting ATPase subunit epsilon
MILEIVSPEAKLFSGEITSVTLPGVDGSFQILNHHAAIVSTLTKGAIKIVALSFNLSDQELKKFIKVNDLTYTLEIESGTIEMKDNKIIVLVD